MTTFRRALATFTAAVLAGGVAACTFAAPDLEVSETREPLVGGTITTEDMAVVALTRGGSSSFCTGTLISPRVVLTAAHCIDMAGNDPGFTAFFGSDTNTTGLRIGIDRPQKHLGWTGSLSGGNDIGLLLLDVPHPDPMLPLPLNVDSPADAHVGEAYRHVGFGVFDNENQIADGRKRQGTTTITNTAADVILSGDEELSVCFGDSGGPGLLTIDGVEVIAGVHSYTTSPGDTCVAPNGDTRVDLFAADFVIPWIQENDTTCGLDDFCAPIGCIDDPDCTPCGPDGSCTEGCALPDVDCATSAVGDVCRADSQCADGGPCVFWKDEPEYRFCAIECSPGSATCPDGMSCQNVQPFGDVCYFDDTPAGVLGDSCEQATDCGSYKCADGACVRSCDLSKGLGCPANFECETRNDADYYCFALPSDEGGCRSGGPAGGGAALGLLGLLSLVRRRKRRG